ncbi:MAG: NADH-quinone oxidoreductase subunit C [Rhodoferax sp.]|uniref:hydrogenase large subunit n=1 Tax=Rhodoferax sp. TaxID=50421 RepID=UPI00262C93B2|nr:NADH-quinone oxidoreductase subunit C [Rhodoferax sp.]MDD2880412.1 NADH-quinone oxidoreductase subunit C [Rhodoferax sp.]
MTNAVTLALPQNVNATPATSLAPPANHLQPLAHCDLSAQETLSLSELLTQIAKGLEANFLLISLFGRKALPDEPPGVMVTAVLLPPGQALQVLRAYAAPGQNYPSLTASFPAAQIFERELWEQTGLVPQGHPWLKPVRFEGARQGLMADYPFFKVRGAEVHEVGVGPIHAGVIEPGHFRFMCHGEQVHHLEIQLGYQHRGVEALLLKRSPERLTPLVESIVGDSVLAYAWAFNSALEYMANQTVAITTIASRAIGLELERLAMHLGTLNGLATDMAYLQPAATYGRLRTAIINASQRVCGNRFGRGWIRPGAAAPIGDELRQDLLATLRAFLPDFVQVNALICSSRSAQARLRGVGTVSAQAARDLGLTGVVARASGLGLDLRHALAGNLYGHYPVQPVQPIQQPMQPRKPAEQASGDCWARMSQRMLEAEASTQWLIDLLADTALNLKDTPPPFPQQGGSAGTVSWALQPNTLCVSLVEGVRGPVMVALETDAAGQLIHAKVQDPSAANWFGLAFSLRNQQISDFPICNKSFDLSYCGNDL